VVEMTLPPSETAAASRTRRCAEEIMLKKVAVDLEYLEANVDIDDPNPTLDKQIMQGLFNTYRDKELGYADGQQKKQLHDNTQKGSEEDTEAGVLPRITCCHNSIQLRSSEVLQRCMLRRDTYSS